MLAIFPSLLPSRDATNQSLVSDIPVGDFENEIFFYRAQASKKRPGV